MKNLKLLLLLAVLAIVGCTQEETFTEETNENFSRQIMIEQDGEVKIFDLDDYDTPVRNTTTLNKNNGNSSHAHGSYIQGLNGTRLVDFSVTENNGGTHGSIVLTVGTALGNDIVLYMDTSCVYELGNGEVIFAGIATSVENNVPGNFFELGGTYFFKAIDNGQGKNADSDVAFVPNVRWDGGTCDDPVLLAFFNQFPEFYQDIGNNSANMQSPYGVKVN